MNKQQERLSTDQIDTLVHLLDYDRNGTVQVFSPFPGLLLYFGGENKDLISRAGGEAGWLQGTLKYPVSSIINRDLWAHNQVEELVDCVMPRGGAKGICPYDSLSAFELVAATSDRIIVLVDPHYTRFNAWEKVSRVFARPMRTLEFFLWDGRAASA